MVDKTKTKDTVIGEEYVEIDISHLQALYLQGIRDPEVGGSSGKSSKFSFSVANLVQIHVPSPADSGQLDILEKIDSELAKKIYLDFYYN